MEGTYVVATDDFYASDMERRSSERRQARLARRRRVCYVLLIVLLFLIILINVITLPIVFRHRGSPSPTSHLLVDSGNQLKYSTVLEGSPSGSAVAKVDLRKMDGSHGEGVQCQTTNSNFSLVQMPAGGYTLITTEVFDREDQEVYMVEIQCDSPDSGRLTVLHEVKILDVNDWAPEFEEVHYHIKVRENNPTDMHLLTFKARDRDTGLNAIISYGINREAQDYVELDGTSGELRAKISFDRELCPEYYFQVQAVDHGKENFTAHTNVTLTVVDVNDKHPFFRQDHYHFQISEGRGADALVGKVTATDLDDPPHDAVHYTLDEGSHASQHFRIDEVTGAIYTTGDLHTFDQTSQPFLVTATNTEPPFYSSQVTVYIQVVRQHVPPVVGGAATARWSSLALGLILLLCCL